MTIGGKYSVDRYISITIDKVTLCEIIDKKNIIDYYR